MYEEMIKELEKNGDYKVIRRLKQVECYQEDDGEEKYIGIYLDVETTGLNSDKDKVIELSMIPFEYSRSGKIYRVFPDYTSYQDPGIRLPTITTQITGITDEMVADHMIDLTQVDKILSTASIVIAHNAKFDRGFMENFHDAFKDIAWGCSFADINWVDEGAGSMKLDYLVYEYGFFYDAHRANIDCQAGIKILSEKLPKSGVPVLKRLLDTAFSTTCRLWAVNSPFDKKDVLKQRGYRWSAGSNNEPKAWYIDLVENSLDDELSFLRDEINIMNVEHLPMMKIDAMTRYSKVKSIK